MKKRTRRLVMAGVGVVAAIALLAGCDVGFVQTRYSYQDPAGDQRLGTPSETDILKVAIKATTQATVSVEVADAVPFEEWGTALDSISITILDGNRTLDLFADHNGAALYDGSPPICTVTRSFNAEKSRYSFSFARNCLHERRWLLVQKVRTFHIPGDQADRAGNNNSLQIPSVCFTGATCPQSF